jgi:heptosyltransferase-2/heptosyltransferase-3
MVMLSSVLHFLHHRFHRPCVVLGAGTWNEHVYRGHPDVEQVWSFTRHAPFLLSLTWWRVLRVLHRTAPGPIYICERHPRQLARVRRLLALSGIDQARCLFITDMPVDGNEHWVDRFVRFGALTPPALETSDYPAPQSDCLPAPRLQVSQEERFERDAWLNTRGWAGRRLVLVQPGNHRSMSRRRDRWRHLNADDKAWPTANWARLLDKIHARMPDALLLLCGAPMEALMLQEIRSTSQLAAVAVADLPLRQLLALCEVAHSMISVDTGPAHAAAALSVPLLVMFGAEPQQLWLARSPSLSPVLGVGGPPNSVRVDQLAVDDVFDAWCALLAKVESAANRAGAPACDLVTS